MLSRMQQISINIQLKGHIKLCNCVDKLRGPAFARLFSSALIRDYIKDRRCLLQPAQFNLNHRRSLTPVQCIYVIISHRRLFQTTVLMASKVPNAILSNGNSIPMIGLGTWGSPPGQVAQAVKDAIDVGYRHIDCAMVYENEHEVGDGVAAKIKEGVIKRQDIFITSKLWNTFHRPDLVEGALRTTLNHLKLDYLDLYLIHWPVAYKEGSGLFPYGPDGKTYIFSDVDYVDTWKAMEKLVDAGLAKNIGLSNFNAKQVQRVLDVARIKPVVNQIECHPYLTQAKLSAFCADKGIIVTAYSPLASPARPWVKEDDPVLLENETLKALAKKYGRDRAQILIRYQIQLGHVVIPKSVTKSRIASNFDVFSFTLDAGDMKLLTGLDRNERICPEFGAFGHPHHPFEKGEQ